MSNEAAAILSGLVLGLVGSAHCAGMCGPIALALPLASDRWWHFLTGRLLYNVGRAVTYSLMGLLVGYAGNELLAPALQQRLSIVAGSLIVVSVLAPAALQYVRRGSLTVPRVVAAIKNRIVAMLSIGSRSAMFGIGVLNGLLPCGLVYVALAAASIVGSAWGSSLFMAGFGFGTMPALFAMSVFPRIASMKAQKFVVRALPVLTVLVGVLLIVRGLNLGIPFLSPDLQSTMGQQGHCH